MLRKLYFAGVLPLTCALSWLPAFAVEAPTAPHLTVLAQSASTTANVPDALPFLASTVDRASAAAPQAPRPRHYRVVRGDSLADIAYRFAIPGGWPALYRANRAEIGPDPTLIRIGAVFTLPGGTTSTAPSAATAPSAGTTPRPRQPATAPPPSQPAPKATPSTAAAPTPQPAPHSGAALAGVPHWFKVVLLLAGLLIALALVTAPLLRRRRGRVRTVPNGTSAVHAGRDQPGHRPETRPATPPATPVAAPVPAGSALRPARAGGDDLIERFAQATEPALREIAGSAALLARNHLREPEADRHVRQVSVGGERVRQLVDGLVSYWRLAHKPVAIQLLDSSLALLDAFHMLLVRDGTQEAVITHAQPLPRVYADRALLAELLSHLLRNALVHAGPGRIPLVRVSAARDGRFWRFEIADNGPGIPPRDRERIFEAFTSLDAATPGGGLGLTICRHIVAVHGGRIWLEDNPPVGSRFCFTLPAGRAADPPEPHRRRIRRAGGRAATVRTGAAAESGRGPTRVNRWPAWGRTRRGSAATWLAGPFTRLVGADGWLPPWTRRPAVPAPASAVPREGATSTACPTPARPLRQSPLIAARSQEMHIVIADHDRVVVSFSEPERAVIVLRPVHVDPRAVLQVARLVLPSGAYRALASRLGVSDDQAD